MGSEIDTSIYLFRRLDHYFGDSCKEVKKGVQMRS